MQSTETRGRLLALFTVIIWGTTFVSTKVLLTGFTPLEILFFRFVLGLVFLFVLCPHKLPKRTFDQEKTLAAAGLCGICLYYLLENIALTYTMASNVGVIICVAPFFTALVNHLFMKQREPIRRNFFIGFLVSMAGICLISFNGTSLHFSPVGDLLSVLAAVVWSFYSNLVKKISSWGWNTILTTRRVFAYGILFMIPALGVLPFRLDLERLCNPVWLGNLLFLGLGASAICFVTWNGAVKLLGAVKTSVFIYLAPVVTVILSALILHETITPLAVAGTLLTLSGLVFSSKR